MGDTGEAYTGNETVSVPSAVGSLTHESNSKDAMPLLRVAVDDNDGNDAADQPSNHEVTTPHLRVAVDDDDTEEDMSGDEPEEDQEEEHQEAEEDGDAENPMEEPVVEDSETLASVRIVAHVTDGMADSDTGEQLAFPEEQYDEESEEEHREDHEDDHNDNHEGDNGESHEGNNGAYEDDEEDHEEDSGVNRAVVHVHVQADNQEDEVNAEDYEDQHEGEVETRPVVHVQAGNQEDKTNAEDPEDHYDDVVETRSVVHVQADNHEEYHDLENYGDDGEKRAVLHVQGSVDDLEEIHEEHHQAQHESEMSQEEDDQAKSHFENERAMEHLAEADEPDTLINLADESEFAADNVEGEAGNAGVNGGGHAGVPLQEQLGIDDVKVTGEKSVHHDQPDATEEVQQTKHASVSQHDQTTAISAKPGASKVTEKTPTAKKKPHSIVPRGKASSASAPGSRAHAQSESDGSNRAKRSAVEEGDASVSASHSGVAPHTRPSLRASRTKLTIPQPFQLATEKRASLGGRPVDTDAPKPRTPGNLAKRSHPAAHTKNGGAMLGGIRAVPTEISKEDQEALETLEKDRDAKLEEEMAALRIKTGNPSGFSFKSDERAEKRREFYSKLEEKMKAKEEEKNQIQAKSQEELENKMKQLRKSLAFKATPLPSFYQEAGPPKVEVKKTPPTRPKSPKLTTSRRSTLVGDPEGSRSPVARIRTGLNASALGLPHKSVDLTDHKKANVRKSMSRSPSMEKSAVRPKVNGHGDGKSETTTKAKPASVLPSPRKASTVAGPESGMNKTPKKADTVATLSSNRGTDSYPKRSLRNGGPSTDRSKTTEEGKSRNTKLPGGVTIAESKDGVRKSMQWRSETANSTTKGENPEVEPAKLVVATMTKGDVMPDVPIA